MKPKSRRKSSCCTPTVHYTSALQSASIGSIAENTFYNAIEQKSRFTFWLNNAETTNCIKKLFK